MLHSSYSFALAFEPDLVSGLLSRFAVPPGAIVLDPFCGTGTTLLESKIQGCRSVGVDANPICVMVSRAKTDWSIDGDEVEELADRVVQRARRRYEACLDRMRESSYAGTRFSVLNDPIFAYSPAGSYLLKSGLVRRGWISPRPAMKTLLLSQELQRTPARCRRFLFLALLGLLVPNVSNMAYGPEIYRKRKRRDCGVFQLFATRVLENLGKVRELRARSSGPKSIVRVGDSVNDGLSFVQDGSVDVIISSPPYLSDHDYSRLTRLELVFTGVVSSREDLRSIKRSLMRSSSKNVYKNDSFGDRVKGFSPVQEAVQAVAARAAKKPSGFARVYPRLIGEYFGGMFEHFRAAGRLLRSKGYAAYVIGDQSSFFAVPIPTARIVADIATKCGSGLELVGMEPIRKFRGTRGRVSWQNSEWLILLRKTSRRELRAAS